MGRPPKDGSRPVQRVEREALRASAFTPPPIPATPELIKACIEEHAGLALVEDVAALANVPVEDLKDGGCLAVIYARAASWKNIRVGQAQYEKATARSGSPIPGIAWMNNGIWKPTRAAAANEGREIAEIRLTVVDGTSQGIIGGRRSRARRAPAPKKEAQDARSGMPEVGPPAPEEGPV